MNPSTPETVLFFFIYFLFAAQISVNKFFVFTFFSQLMACIKSGRISNSRFDQLAREAQLEAEEEAKEETKKKAISVDRSGGGV